MSTVRGMRIILAGDSTLAPYIATEYPLCGWGAHLGAALGTLLARGEGPVHVVDLAKNGASTRSHREDGLWDAVLESAAADDLVVLQFGHNDQKHEDLDAHGGFTAQLSRMLGEVRDLGARPVLCTPVARRRFESGQLVATHGEHPRAVLSLGEREKVPVLDLHEVTSAMIRELGEEGSQRLFGRVAAGTSTLRPEGLEDDTHFSIDGAIAVADRAATLLEPLLRDRD